ncbi:hypothetical protein L0664_07845 [Octadecabacter sp. G9-8]|uniref:RidA family protein n=1 Tax=Octadecabacter dasysiphoniae TaxID=2909341 RepID=A0ABS9CX50_9RHOB|nr:hypothetical protein [Octadecabacter dasysiphoniae]MCF2870974.1 hypothetical protein [Octadecabacter dasysiphoniae]
MNTYTAKDFDSAGVIHDHAEPVSGDMVILSGAAWHPAPDVRDTADAINAEGRT